MVSTEERTLREGLRRRDPASWETLFRTSWAALFRQARLVLPRHRDPENAAAEVWARALRLADRYDPERPPYPWLARICLRVCLDLQRDPRRFLPEFLAEHVPAPRDRATAQESEARDAVRNALRALPPRLCEIVGLRYLFGLSVAEIATLLDVDAATVRKSLLRGLDRLRGPDGPSVLDSWVSTLKGGGS